MRTADRAALLSALADDDLSAALPLHDLLAETGEGMPWVWLRGWVLLQGWTYSLWLPPCPRRLGNVLRDWWNRRHWQWDAVPYYGGVGGVVRTMRLARERAEAAALAYVLGGGR